MITINKLSKTSPRRLLHEVPMPETLPGWEGGLRPNGSFWQPINHGELADTICQTIEDIGLEVLSEHWSLCMKNNVGLIGAVKVRTPSEEVADSLGFNSDAFEARGMETTILARHANNARWALDFLSGGDMKVCTNGCIWGSFGSIKVKKKHSSKVVLEDFVRESIFAVCQNFNGLIAMQDRLSEMGLTRMEGDHLIVEAARHDIMPWRMVQNVVKEWRAPRHPEFEPMNAWSLYNCVTECAKERSPRDQVKTIAGMSDMLVKYGKQAGMINETPVDEPSHEIEIVSRGVQDTVFSV